MKYSIYLLSCPNTHEPKYIGASKNVDKRFKQHCRFTENLKNTARCNWLRKIIEQGLKPAITILEDNLDCYDQAERKWIKEYSAKYKLLNGNAGGFDLSHTHAAASSNKSRGRRTKLAVYLSILKAHINSLEKKGDVKAEHFKTTHLNLISICNKKRKEGTYELFVQMCEERLPG